MGLLNQHKMNAAKKITDVTLMPRNGKQVVYIAGKVTGLPRMEVLRNFLTAERELTNKGYQTINPVRLVHPDASWQDAMRICLSFLPHADYIFLLHNWKDSAGARLELVIAERLGIVSI